MKIPRSELPVFTAAVNTAPVKAVPDPPPGQAAAAGESGMRPEGGDAAPVPARADIGNWPDPM
ncbi:hypothetical protein ACFUTU_18605 [Arthrobacter sp. NPDC057388]|jgi:hypothetical protein|uniref:hypothetical protein n=1 Tax=Arthrobacter sp. NPDC057388 TaxID=3346116 RepID=UPI003636555B